MKKKIIFTIVMGVIAAFLIYKTTYKEEMNILALGDSLALGMTAYNVEGYSFNDYLKDYYEKNSVLREYIKEFSSENETTTSLLEKIDNNQYLANVNMTIQQAITDAKIITIALGMDELNNKKTLKSKDIDTYITNIKKLLTRLRIYNQNEILLISLYPSSKIKSSTIEEINTNLSQFASEQNVKFIDITTIIKHNEFFFIPTSYYLNYKGHQYINELLIENLT